MAQLRNISTLFLPFFFTPRQKMQLCNDMCPQQDSTTAPSLNRNDNDNDNNNDFWTPSCAVCDLETPSFVCRSCRQLGYTGIREVDAELFS